MNIQNKKSGLAIVTGQFIRFGIVGFIGAVLNYSIFFILYHFFSVYYLISSMVGYFFGILVGLFLNRKFTFKINYSSKSMTIKYFLVNIFSIVVGMVFLKFFVEILNLNVYIANLLIIGITMTLNFTGSKLIAFR